MKIIEVEGLAVRYGRRKALDDFSFYFDAGTVCALVGPAGAGKTTLLDAISGHVRPATGAVRLGGRSITAMPAHQVAARGLRRTFQNGGLFPSLTVLQNVLCGLHQAIGTRCAERAATESAVEMLAGMGLADLAANQAKDLSVGQRRRVEIARALISKPRIVLLDEPAVGLSAAECHALGVALRALAAEGAGVLVAARGLDATMAVPDKVVVLNETHPGTAAGSA